MGTNIDEMKMYGVSIIVVKIFSHSGRSIYIYVNVRVKIAFIPQYSCQFVSLLSCGSFDPSLLLIRKDATPVILYHKLLSE